MYKQSPGRNHRSRGIKVKHILQICLLLAVCFWLIYQVKHSHDKKKEFDEGDTNFSIKTGTSNELVKLGRKDLQPRIEVLDTVGDKHREEPEDETGEEEEEGNKVEEDLEEENKTKEKNDEHREDVEDEVDDHDQEKLDVEVDQEENVTDDKDTVEDDEKETEERDSEENDGKVEEENSLEDHDHDEDSSSSHEAREEHYKGDDASSAVTQDTSVTTSETENGKLEQGGERTAEATNEVNAAGQNTTALKLEDGKTDGEGILLNTTKIDEKDDNLISNSTKTEGLIDSSELKVQSTVVSMQGNDLSLQNVTQAVTQGYNVTVEDTTSGGSNQSINSSQQNTNSADKVDNSRLDSNLTFTSENDRLDSIPVNSTNASSDNESSVLEKVIPGDATVKTEDSVELPLENRNSTEVENSDTNNENGTADEGVDASITENPGEVQDDPVDSSAHLEEKHIRTDLETLPEIQTEGSNTEDAAAE